MLQHVVEGAPVGEARKLVGERRPAQLVALELRVQERRHHVGEEAQLAAVLGADPGSTLAHRHQVGEVHAGARHRYAHSHLPGRRSSRAKLSPSSDGAVPGESKIRPARQRTSNPSRRRVTSGTSSSPPSQMAVHQLIQPVLAEHLVQDRRQRLVEGVVGRLIPGSIVHRYRIGATHGHPSTLRASEAGS
jgi:hypothetical protein